MIKILVTVANDMQAYLVLLMIAIVAFGGTFFLLSNNQAASDQYFLTYLESLMSMWDWALSN